MWKTEVAPDDVWNHILKIRASIINISRMYPKNFYGILFYNDDAVNTIFGSFCRYIKIITFVGHESTSIPVIVHICNYNINYKYPHYMNYNVHTSVNKANLQKIALQLVEFEEFLHKKIRDHVYAIINILSVTVINITEFILNNDYLFQEIVLSLSEFCLVNTIIKN